MSRRNNRGNLVDESRFIKEFTYYNPNLKRPVSVRPHGRTYHVKDKNAAVFIKHPNRNLWDGVYPNKFNPVDSKEAKMLKWVENDGVPKSNFPPEIFGVGGLPPGLNEYLYKDVGVKHKDLREMLVLNSQLQDIQNPKVDKEVTKKVEKMKNDLERLHNKTTDRRERDFIRESLEDIDKLEENMIYARRGKKENYEGFESRMKAMKGILKDLKSDSPSYKKMMKTIPPDIELRGIGSRRKMAETHERGSRAAVRGVGKIFENNAHRNKIEQFTARNLHAEQKITGKEYKKLKEMEEKVNKTIEQNRDLADYDTPIFTI